MYHLACLGQLLIALLLVGLENIQSKRSGQGSQRTTRSRVSGSNQTDDEHDTDEHREVLAPRHGAEDGVTRSGFARHIGIFVHVEQSTQHQKHANHENLDKGTDNHVLLRFLEVLAAQRTLHQVLVQTGGGNHHEHTGHELFPEITAVVEVIEEEYFAGRMVCHGSHYATQAQIQGIGNKHDTAYHRCDETERLERVRPNQGLHTSLERI